MSDKMSDDLKLQLIKKAISTQAGWKKLAQSVRNNPLAKDECIRLLQIIGHNRLVALPVDDGSNFEANLSELLVSQLEKHIQELEG